MSDCCPGCERPVATDTSVCPCTPDDPGCDVCNALCWSSMHGYATCPWVIDWRARCLEVERIARLAIDALHQRSYGRSMLGARLQAELEKLR